MSGTESGTDAGVLTGNETGTAEQKVIITLFADRDFGTRVAIAAVIIMFLFFAYYLIGGYTTTCSCGESYQNCGCHRGTTHAHHHGQYHGRTHAHPYGNVSHVHQPPSSNGSSNIYQAGPYLNF